MNSLTYFIKRNFPNIYTRIREFLFPLVQKHRQKKATLFINPMTKDVSVLGYNYEIQLDPTNGFIDTQIFTTGTYELDILKVIAQHLKPGDTFIDIGGNIGWHTLFGAHVVGRLGHVYTFEPIPKLIKQLQRSVTLNKLEQQVKLFPFGCSDHESEQTININSINIGGSSLFTLKDHSVHSETITLRRADDVLADKLSSVSLIKIDTEGSELEALLGLSNILDKHHPALIIEYSPSFWGDKAFEKSQTFFAFLAQKHYKVFDLESGHVEINPNNDWIKNFTKLQTNFLCVASSTNLSKFTL